MYNNKETILDCMQSAFSQTDKDIEYIIIDGASQDGTFDLISNNIRDSDIFISEPDNGIYDAMNKGIQKASGNIIGFLHSDDVYAGVDTISYVSHVFENNQIDGVYGDLVYTAKNDDHKIFRHWYSQEFTPKLLKFGWMPAHPTLFLRREVYEKIGGFDEQFKIAADYDFMLRLFKNYTNILYTPKLLYKMRVGGVSNRSLKNILAKSKEDLAIIRKNKVGGIGTLICKNLRKLPQFTTNKLKRRAELK